MGIKDLRVLFAKTVKKTGKKDGRDWRWKFFPPQWPFWEDKEPTPKLDQRQLSNYEEKLIKNAEAIFEDLAQEWAEKDKLLTARYKDANGKKEALETQMVNEQIEKSTAAEKYETAQNRFNDFPPRWIPLWLYYSIFGVITCAEGFFNITVFQMFGRKGEALSFESIIMAVGIVLTIPVASEIIGHFLKKKTKTNMDKYLIGLTAFVVVALLVSIAILREIFFGLTDYTLQISPVKLAGILISFNIAIFVVLTFLSYTEAREEPEKYRLAKKIYEDAKARYEKEDEDVKAILNELIQAERELNNVKSEREHTFEIYKSEAEEVRDGWVRYIRIYRKANMDARKNKEIPWVWREGEKDPDEQIEIPEVFLQDLTWDEPDEKKTHQ